MQYLHQGAVLMKSVNVLYLNKKQAGKAALIVIIFSFARQTFAINTCKSSWIAATEQTVTLRMEANTTFAMNALRRVKGLLHV